MLGYRFPHDVRGAHAFPACSWDEAGVRHQLNLDDISGRVEISLDGMNYISNNTEMKSDAAIRSLAALAQEHRLALFRLLVRAGPAGLAAGRIADALGLANSSLSHHLSQLHEAGLIAQRREGRSLIYSADYAAMERLLGFLTENCCAGEPCLAPPACEEIAA